jgi:HD-like signal output (HDOD) protein/CheY-like chemotaxis protein
MALVLVVEDMAVFREPIEAALRTAGYQTAAATNGVEGLASVTAQRPDLILLDLAMPVMDGLTFLQHLRNEEGGARIPVIVLTGFADKHRVVQALQLGVRAYLLKSEFSLQRLLDKIRECLGAQSAKPQTAAVLRPTLTVAAEAGRAAGTASAPRPARASAAPPDAVAALKSLKPIMSKAELLEKVKACCDLKALSPTVALVLKLTSNPQCATEAVSRAIAQDHAIALKILKLANSAVYTRGAPVDSVQKAVVRIGLERIRQTVLNISVVDRFSSHAFEKHLSSPQFWEHAIACGIIAAELAHARDEKEADGAFTMGLLHDVGRVIFAEQLGERYVEVIETARRLHLPLEQVESRMLLMNHADVMETVLRAWNFPAHLTMPIVLHHLSAGNVRSIAPKHVAEVCRLALADRLAHALLLGSSGNDTVYPIEDLCRAISVEASVIGRIEANARAQTDAVKFAMLSSGSTANWPQRRDELRTALGHRLRALFVSASPMPDAMGMLCRELSESTGEEPANLAVAHLTNAQEQESVGTALVESERVAGVAGLPLIVLSPTGKLGLEERIVRGRHYQLLPTPLAISRLIVAVSTALSTSTVNAAA